MSRPWKKPSIYNVKEVAELSTPVLSANYHQFLYLNKQLRILERSENTFVKNITIEQKIMYRRYMEKLYRSKINFARMWGNKDMERKLRSQKLSYLSTGGGDLEAEAAFLKVLQRRAFSAQLSKITTSFESRTSKDIEEFMESITIGEQSQRSIIHKPRRPGTGCRRPTDRSRSMSDSPPPRQVTVRPVTAIGAQVDKEFNVMPDIPGTDTETKIQNYIDIVIDKVNDINEDERTDSIEDVDSSGIPRLNLRPKTCSGKMQRRHTTGTVDLNQLVPTPPQEPRKKRRSIFVENSRQEELQKQIEKLKKRNFTQEIEKFCASLEPYILEKNNSVDYYAKKVMDSIALSEKMKRTQQMTSAENVIRQSNGVL